MYGIIKWLLDTLTLMGVNFQTVENMLKKYFQFLPFLAFATSSAFSQSEFTEQTEVYVDSVRNRKLATEIWLPETNSKQLPLVMFSHGTGGNRIASRWFCEGLAQRGFAVVAVDHFGNTFDNPIPVEFLENRGIICG